MKPISSLFWILFAAAASSAGAAANAFVSVTPAAGAAERRCGCDFAVDAGPDGMAVELRAQPGWRLLTPSRVRVSRDETPRYRVASDDGEQTGQGDILAHEELRESVHASDPSGHVVLQGGGTVFVDSTNVVHLASFSASAVVDTSGRHSVTITGIDYLNGEEAGRTVETEEEEIEPDQWTWTWRFGPHHGTTNGSVLAVSDLPLPVGRHALSVSVHGVSSACDRCKIDATATTNLLVWTLQTETVAPIPEPRDRRRIGVGEAVRIVAVPATETGDAVWTLAGGGSLCSRECNPVRYTAGATGGVAAVTATLPGGSSGFVSFAVVEPNSVLFVWKRSTKSNAPLSMDLFMDVHISPEEVNFSAVSFGEGTCRATAGGYFSDLDGAEHAASAVFKAPQSLVPGSGWKLAGEDVATCHTRGPIYADGTFLWNIPWEYSLDGDTHAFANAVHDNHISISPTNATLTVSKGNVSDSVSVSR